MAAVVRASKYANMRLCPAMAYYTTQTPPNVIGSGLPQHRHILRQHDVGYSDAKTDASAVLPRILGEPQRICRFGRVGDAMTPCASLVF